MTFFFRVKDAVMNVPADLGKLFSGAAKAAKAKMKSPFKKLPGSEGGADSAAAGKEVLEDTPWFVGKTPRGEVESALEVGLAGDYVIRESGTTAGAYVFVLKLSPTEFIERKIRKDAKGRYVTLREGALPTTPTVFSWTEDLPPPGAARFFDSATPPPESAVSDAALASTIYLYVHPADVIVIYDVINIHATYVAKIKMAGTKWTATLNRTQPSGS